MKKFFALALAVVLCMSLSLSVFASDYVVGEDGNAVMDDAYGYAISIDDINGIIEGEDATIITDASKIGQIGGWSRYFIASKVADNEYVVATDVACPGGPALTSIALEAGQVVVAVHSASSNPADAEKYPNWHDYVATAAIKVGDMLTLAGIDLAAGTVNNGTITVSAPDGEGEGEGSNTVIVSKNVAAGKTYTGAAVADEKYTANLTDGVASNETTYDSNWFGLYYNSKSTTPSVNAPDGVATIIIDLEDVYDLNEIKLHFWNANASGIAAPSAIKVSASEDGTTYSEEIAVDPAAGDAPAWTAKELGDLSGRYVKVVFNLTDTATWCFLNEIEVYGDVEVDAGDAGDNGSSSTPSTPVKPGDASNTIVFAILALVAITGSAVVIKTRK